MGARLVLIHGRAQEGKRAESLKAFWTNALRAGLKKGGMHLQIDDAEVKLPYYGQALFDRISAKSADEIADIIVRGSWEDVAEAEFMLAVLREVAAARGISRAQIDSIEPTAFQEKGVQNWAWVRQLLIALDRYVPYASAASIAMATSDAYQYLFNPAIANAIDDGVREAMAPDMPTVVVAHSLGSVIAYRLLREASRSWNVPLFVTLGSPLAITAIRKRLQPLRHPPSVRRWFNAMDPRDVVALYPLTRAHFAIDPEIENKTDVDNFTDNRHSVEGYLEDAEVAARIARAILEIDS